MNVFTVMGPFTQNWLWTVKATFGDHVLMEGTRDPSTPTESGASRPLWARFVQLIAGLFLFGTSNALMVRADLGLDPWNVLHQGLARQTTLAIGTWSVIVGAVVLLLWIPLRQRPGIGTVCNVVLIGVSLDAVLEVLPAPHGLAVRCVYLVGGIVLCGIATGAYIGANLGPGPRDGLMVGLARRGHSIRIVRTAIELAVLLSGFLLGGSVGIGTVLFAVTIGPLAHVTIPAFSSPRRRVATPACPQELACASG
jgi:uncharacterized membrane protein YczE